MTLYQVKYHEARGDVKTKLADWLNQDGGVKHRIVSFLAPISAPKRVLQIIGKEHTVITEWQYVRPQQFGFPDMYSTYKPDTMGQYVDVTAVFRVRKISGKAGCEAMAQIRVAFHMALVGHLFEVRVRVWLSRVRSLC